MHCGGTAVLIEKSRDVGLFSAKVTVYFPTGMVIFVEVQSTQNNSLISMVAGSKVFSFFVGRIVIPGLNTLFHMHSR